MDPVQRDASTKEIIHIFAAYRAAQSTDSPMLAALTDGKLYELFVLSRVVQELDGRGFKLRFVGSKAPGGATAIGHSTLKFKASPGMMKKEDSHFEVTPPAPSKPTCFLFVNIEFDTLGEGMTGTTDLSRRHELDIVLTTAMAKYPSYKQIALGVECKAVANFEKGIVKEALGVRRELSFLNKEQASLPTVLGGAPAKRIPADPPSEFLFVFIDSKGLNYEGSPKAFGIDFRHMQP